MAWIFAFLHELLVRLTLKNPVFYQKLQKYCGVVIALIAAVIGVNYSMHLGWELIALHLWNLSTNVIGLMELISAALASIILGAQFSVEDRTDLALKLNNPKSPSYGRVIQKK